MAHFTVARVLAKDAVKKPLPKWVPVDSENLKSLMYSPEERILIVKFQNDAEYAYAEVSERLFQNLQRADSPTAYLRRFVIPNHKAVKL